MKEWVYPRFISGWRWRLHPLVKFSKLYLRGREARSWGSIGTFTSLRSQSTTEIFLLARELMGGRSQLAFKNEVFNALQTRFGPSKYTSLRTTLQNATPKKRKEKITPVIYTGMNASPLALYWSRCPVMQNATPTWKWRCHLKSSI
jgi:hypothetical protein